MLTDSAYNKDQLKPTSEAVVETINCLLKSGYIEYAKENNVYSQSWYIQSMPQNCKKSILYMEYTEGQLLQVKNKQPIPDYQDVPRTKTLEPCLISPIESWNKQFPVGDVLQEHGYKLVLPGNPLSRWISPNSTSGQGGVTEDHTTGKIFSHHNDCLNDNYRHDSFDVMRLLKGLSFKEAIKLASKETKAPDGRTVDEHNKSMARSIKTTNMNEIIFNQYSPFDANLLPVQKINYEILPEIMRDFIKEKSDILGCPDDYILVSLLARMDCVCSGKIKIKLTEKSGWSASPNFFWALIGEPSTGKSPAMECVNGGVKPRLYGAGCYFS